MEKDFKMLKKIMFIGLITAGMASSDMAFAANKGGMKSDSMDLRCASEKITQFTPSCMSITMNAYNAMMRHMKKMKK